VTVPLMNSAGSSVSSDRLPVKSMTALPLPAFLSIDTQGRERSGHARMPRSR
jgi:hypothetical protein